MTDITDLRLYIDEPTDVVYPDATLLARIETAASLYHLARDIWLEKAARYSRLVDMTEGTSSRKLSQLQQQSLAMANNYGGLAQDGTNPSSARRTRLRAIERP